MVDGQGLVAPSAAPRVDPDVRLIGTGRRRGDGLVHDVWLGLRQGRLREYAPPGVVARGPDGRVAPLEPYRLAWADGSARFLDQAHRLYAAAPAFVPRIWRVGDEAAGPWMISAPAGQPLAESLAAGITLSPRDVIRIARDFADALDAIHALGVTHLDISPDTVSVTSGQVTLSDFAVDDRAFLRLLGSAEGLVRPCYSPIEMYEGEEPLGPATDIFAASALVYRLMAGADPAPWQQRWRDAGPLALPVDAADYPPAFVAAIRRGLAVEPGHRFANALAWKRAMGDPAPAPLDLAKSEAVPVSEVVTSEAPWPDPAPPQPAGGRAGWLVVAVIAVLGLTALLVTYLMLRPGAEATEAAAAAYVATGPANIRTAPRPGAEIVARLVAGDRVTGVMSTADSGERWLRITEGQHAGAFVWARNLALPGAVPVPPSQPAAQPKAAPPSDPPALDLSARFSYDQDANCRFHPQIDTALRTMVAYPSSRGSAEGRAVSIGTMRLTPDVKSERVDMSGDSYYQTDAVLTLPQEVRWNGLRVRRLVSGSGYEDGMSGVVFAEDPATVRGKLAEMGVSVPLPPGHLELPTEACSASVWLERRNGGTALICGSGC